MMRLLMAGIVVIGLAACTGQSRNLTPREMDAITRRSTDERVQRSAPDSCQMAQYANLVGTRGADINRATLPSGTRVICHNCSVTMDYRAERLNIDLDADGNVSGLRCG